MPADAPVMNTLPSVCAASGTAPPSVRVDMLVSTREVILAERRGHVNEDMSTRTCWRDPGAGGAGTREALMSLRHPLIYGELRKLADEGLIEVDSEGPRGRKAYRATDAGVAEVRRWLTQTEVDHTLRLEPLLRSVFFWLMTPDELAAHLDREAAYFHELAAKLRDLAAAKDRGEYEDSPQTQSLRVAAEAGIRINEALGGWAEWARDKPDLGQSPGRDAP